MGQKMCICQTFTYARASGVQVAITAGDNFCVPSSAGHNRNLGGLNNVIAWRTFGIVRDFCFNPAHGDGLHWTRRRANPAADAPGKIDFGIGVQVAFEPRL